MTNHTTNEAQKPPPHLPDMGEPDERAPVDREPDAPAQAQEDAPQGGGGGRATGGGSSLNMHSDAEDFPLKGDSSPSPKKKSKGAARPDVPRDAAACAPGASEPHARGEGAAAAENAAKGPSVACAEAVPPPRVLTVFRLCHNPRLVLAKLDRHDAHEEPKRMRVRRPGTLRVGQPVKAVPGERGEWRQVL